MYQISIFEHIQIFLTYRLTDQDEFVEEGVNIIELIITNAAKKSLIFVIVELLGDRLSRPIVFQKEAYA